MAQKRTLALADFLVDKTKQRDKVIIPSHLRFDGWLSTTTQLRRSIMSTFREMERTKNVEHIKSLTILKLRVSNPIIRILSPLLSLCSNATSIKMELEYPSAQSVQYEMMHNRVSQANRHNNNDDPDQYESEEDFNTLMVSEETLIKYMRQLFHTISYLANLKVMFIRFIEFPPTVYQDYISMCFNLKATNYKSFQSLKALTFPIDHNNIQVFCQTESWSILRHFVHEHQLERFTLLLDADLDGNLLVETTATLFNKFCSVFIPTLLHRKHPLSALGILAQSPMNVLSPDIESWKKGMCSSLISPFFGPHSIHSQSLKEFNLYLPNPVPLQDMVDLVKFIAESDCKLIKFRLELPHEQRYRRTKKILELMARFLSKNTQLMEVHFHVTSIVNNTAIRKMFKSIKKHPNLMVFEMSEIQLNSVTWNALIDVFECNTNLQVFKMHFKYKPWHKVLQNKKLNLTNSDPLRIIDALYKNQIYLYQQMKMVEDIMKETWNMSIDTINIMKPFIFNETILKVKVSGLSHDIKKKTEDCFNWFHQLMFNDILINNDSESKGTRTKEQLLYGLDWNILRSHAVKRQLIFK